MQPVVQPLGALADGLQIWHVIDAIARIALGRLPHVPTWDIPHQHPERVALHPTHVLPQAMEELCQVWMLEDLHGKARRHRLLHEDLGHEVVDVDCVLRAAHPQDDVFREEREVRARGPHFVDGQRAAVIIMVITDLMDNRALLQNHRLLLLLLLPPRGHQLLLLHKHRLLLLLLPRGHRRG